MTVNCICDGISFPHGEATNNRIMMIGKAIALNGNEFKVFVNCKRNRNPLNKNVKGVFENISFRHLNQSLEMRLPLWRNAIGYYLIGFFNAFMLIRSLNRIKGNIIHLYSHGTFFNAFVSFFAHVYNVPVVQEVNEWTEEVDGDFWTSIIYKWVMFRWANGAIVISDHITSQIKEHQNPEKETELIRVPVLADKEDWQEEKIRINKSFVWCGLIDGYIKDVLFMIKAFSFLSTQYPEHRLIICGKYKPETEIRIKGFMANLNMDFRSVVLTGYISNTQLFKYCKSATALLSPLWDDQRSIARFPTKIASFLLSSRPVITCDIGEVGKMLSHNKNALFFEPGNKKDLAKKMELLITQSETANQIGKQGQIFAEEHFDYRAYGHKLNEFFSLILKGSKSKTKGTFQTEPAGGKNH